MNKKSIILLLTAILCACGRTVKDYEDRPIFTNDVVEIHGKTAGLTDNINKVYVTLFSDFIGNSKIQNSFDNLLKFDLAENGISVVKKLADAQAVVSGSLESFYVTTSERATNKEGLIYTLKVNYSVIDSDKKYIQKDKSIMEDLLVLDTNNYKADAVLKIMLDNAARHTAEGVCFGWQLDYTKTPASVMILGATNETNSDFNRAQ